MLIQDDLIDRLIKPSGDLVIDQIFIKGQPRPDRLRAPFNVSGDDRCGNGVKGLIGALKQLGLGRAGWVVVFPKGIPVDQLRIELVIDG